MPKTGGRARLVPTIDSRFSDHGTISEIPLIGLELCKACLQRDSCGVQGGHPEHGSENPNASSAFLGGASAENAELPSILEVSFLRNKSGSGGSEPPNRPFFGVKVLDLVFLIAFECL